MYNDNNDFSAFQELLNKKPSFGRGKERPSRKPPSTRRPRRDPKPRKGYGPRKDYRNIFEELRSKTGNNPGFKMPFFF